MHINNRVLCHHKSYPYYYIICLVTQLEPSFYHDREVLMEKEDNEYLGSDLVLSPSEIFANSVLMNVKHSEILNVFQNHNKTTSQLFPPSRNFLVSKSIIEQSDVFKFIKRMPKGMT